METNMTPEAKAAKNAYMRNYKANMSDEAREQRNEYQRRWRRKNPEKLKQYNAEYWERKVLQYEKNILGEQIRKLHEQGHSLRTIGEMMQISHMKVSRILKEMGVLQ